MSVNLYAGGRVWVGVGGRGGVCGRVRACVLAWLAVGGWVCACVHSCLCECVCVRWRVVRVYKGMCLCVGH